MAKMLPGNILYGGDVTCNDASKYPSLGACVLEKIKEFGQDVILIDGMTGVQLSGQKMHDEIWRLAQVLQQLGVKAGDAVGLSSENRLEFAVAMYAIMALNAIIAPLNVTYTKREVHHALNLSKPKAVFASPHTIDIIADVAKDNSFVKFLITFGEEKPTHSSNIYTFKELCENKQRFPNLPNFKLQPAVNKNEDVALIVCSSGTTGMPKGVKVTQMNILRTLDSQYAQPVVPKGITVLGVIPWFHAFGCITLITSNVFGAAMVFLAKFEDKVFLSAIEKYRIMLAFLVPPLMVFLAKHPLVAKYDLSSLLIIYCGAAPLSKETEDQVRDRIGVPIIRQGYGMSESTLSLVIQNDDACSPGSVGALKTGIWGKVIDPETGETLGPNKRGELCFKGDCIMKGYIGDVASTQSVLRDGWLHTGDVGYYTETLEFYIVDRIKELIKYKGFQVPPAEIEALLLTHPKISDAAVIGRPDEAAGELPMAYVVIQAGAKLTASEVEQFVRERTSPAKHLRGGVIFLKEIPKNPSGKILRRLLRDMLKNEKPKSKL